MSGRPPGPRAPRARVRLEAAYEDAERQVFVATGDLSESGAWLLAPDPPQTGLPARLTLELPGVSELLRLRGLVVRRRSEAPAGFAVHFDPDSTTSRSRRVLRRFVEDSLANHERE